MPFFNNLILADDPFYDFIVISPTALYKCVLSWYGHLGRKSASFDENVLTEFQFQYKQWPIQ